MGKKILKQKKRPLTVTVNLMGEKFIIPQKWLYKRITAPEYKYKSRPIAMHGAIVDWISREIVRGKKSCTGQTIK